MCVVKGIHCLFILHLVQLYIEGITNFHQNCPYTVLRADAGQGFHNCQPCVATCTLSSVTVHSICTYFECVDNVCEGVCVCEGKGKGIDTCTVRLLVALIDGGGRLCS